MTDSMVQVPRGVLERALAKARVEYIRRGEQYGQDPGPDHECWAEFEAVARYMDR